jgi:hypothetical protein
VSVLLIGWSKRDLQWDPMAAPSRAYVEAAAPVYWAEAHPDGISPEECADDDMAFWRKET